MPSLSAEKRKFDEAENASHLCCISLNNQSPLSQTQLLIKDLGAFEKTPISKHQCDQDRGLNAAELVIVDDGLWLSDAGLTNRNGKPNPTVVVAYPDLVIQRAIDTNCESTAFSLRFRNKVEVLGKAGIHTDNLRNQLMLKNRVLLFKTGTSNIHSINVEMA